MNKKGFTLIELVLSIVLITIIIVPTFIIVVKFREREQIAADKAQLLEYKNTLTYDIQKDILEKELKNFNIPEECDGYDKCFELTWKNDNKTHIKLKQDEVNYNNQSYALNIHDAKIDISDYDTYDLVSQNDDYIYFEIPINYMDPDNNYTNYNVRIIAKKTS